jgi:hypothetical protein
MMGCVLGFRGCPKYVWSMVVKGVGIIEDSKGVMGQ